MRLERRGSAVSRCAGGAIGRERKVVEGGREPPGYATTAQQFRQGGGASCRWLLDPRDDVVHQQADDAQEGQGGPNCESLRWLILKIQLAEPFVFPFGGLYGHDSLTPSCWNLPPCLPKIDEKTEAVPRGTRPRNRRASVSPSQPLMKDKLACLIGGGGRLADGRRTALRPRETGKRVLCRCDLPRYRMASRRHLADSSGATGLM